MEVIVVVVTGRRRRDLRLEIRMTRKKALGRKVLAIGMIRGKKLLQIFILEYNFTVVIEGTISRLRRTGSGYNYGEEFLKFCHDSNIYNLFEEDSNQRNWIEIGRCTCYRLFIFTANRFNESKYIEEHIYWPLQIESQLHLLIGRRISSIHVIIWSMIKVPKVAIKKKKEE